MDVTEVNMNRKLIVLHHTPIDYSISGPIRFMVRIFNDDKYKKVLLEKYGLMVITSSDIQANYKLTNREFIKTIKNKEEFANGIIFAIHPAGFSGIHGSLGSNKSIKYVIWQDDLHYFANFAKDNRTSNQKYVGKFTCPILDNINHLVTPSSIYFKNLKLEEYYGKIVDMFYCLDPLWFEELMSKSYEKRKDQVVLSGAIGGGYASRIMFDGLRVSSPEFNNLVYKLDHPGRKNNMNMLGMNYYNKLSEFKGAFVGHHNFPINFCLAKHIEVLMCGCLGFYEPNPLLQSQLGLIEFEHYIPCYKDGKLIEDSEFYKKWILSKDGEKIAKRGQEFVMQNFGNKQIHKLFTFLSNC